MLLDATRKLTLLLVTQIVAFPVLFAACRRHDSGHASPTVSIVIPSSVPVTHADGGAGSHASLGKLQFIGRVARMPSGEVRYSWSGAGFRVRFSGRGLNVEMDDSGGFHTVVLDGMLRPSLATQSGARRYTVVENLAPGEHVLELYRRTEPLVGATTLSAVQAVGGRLLTISGKQARQVEVIGDSISCGYGNLGHDTSCQFTAETENHYLTYGTLLARRFGAELSTIAWSGRGVVRNYDGAEGDFMPELYKRILPEQPEITEGQRPPTADLVIVNLGTNDFSTEPDPSESAFVSAYVGLLAEVRRESPNAFILTTIGPMLGGADLERAERYIREAVDNRVKSGDSRVVYHKLLTRNIDPGCNWHPGLKTHQQMAAELEAPVTRALGW